MHFSLNFNTKNSRYYEIVEKCCLFKDFAQFKDFDQTEIGEKGINLSGG